MAAEARVSRWYFGGLASCGAACCTHPLDLVKVHLQTQQEVKLRMTGMALQVVRSDGILALYNGLSASLCRQMTYSLTRFAIYETVRDQVTKGSEGPLPFYKKVLLGSISGCIGGFVGTPADMVNVRMQNDMKLPQNQRRNYAHALDGLYRVAREEGLKKLFSGATMASSRGMLVTVGQLSCYDQAKQLVLSTGYLSDSIFTHFIASFIAGGCATFLCQPLDVLKTRLMNAKGEYQGVLHCAMETAKLGPLAFYKVKQGRGWGRGAGQGGSLQGYLHIPPPLSLRASCLPASASCPTPYSRLCFWSSFANTSASKCRPDVAVGADGSCPAPCPSIFQSPGGSAAERCPEPSTCPPCSDPLLPGSGPPPQPAWPAQ
ncbi:mitochondrial dicarboxylate carrier isoform X1 [Sagmatias obliquidens]|uniref:Mitochondrial dicarboxylate carrier n=1 Tax=Tursiops truncatus TaxID=9739 RepID=A0A6J3QNA2_TURTR|nr:mitochondrial dicarboxylate carrier isoform X1 [Lagenorhynchus obliquidens]XP_030699071.1 mitochondrial dicarboxylate carrier isoform X1 [Globicephala melas]XP_033703722.1 mitochondrial dicarboxylate carrier isoform X1 [Tursiops truncatus]